ncbi:Outer membrane protein beta-barrel domain-containing protein [Parapedobacter luteus]|uniref:Outer membrane protein beta-barrel domain-containing protein n=1 Tax=Parapedobacter luteus TaxID=623280 RepID=A0A1T5CGT2_9SPHI|nr:outer membrane beta-barrel protein [Parapedobacter luteus]SKB58695.1 Outer membrane protein beta-barrel domain-containing protein [Parapedobacter luteus]
MKPKSAICTVYITALLLMLIHSPSLGQQRFQRWGGGVDDETIHFGFSFHYISADYKIALKDNWQESHLPLAPAGHGQLISITSPFAHNVGLGLLADFKLSENLNLRFSPNLVFLNINVLYKYRTPSMADETIAKDMHRSNIELPLLLKFKSDRKGNLRGYLIGGGQYVLNVASSKRYTEDPGSGELDKVLRTKPTYFAYTMGIGFDIYFDFFKMSPEVKWVQSVGNVMDIRSVNMFNSPIDKLTLRSFQFSLFFE